MTTINLAGTNLPIKDYVCIETDDFFKPSANVEYLKKRKPTLWLYVNVTNQCNATCPFCVSRPSSLNNETPDPDSFKKALDLCAPYIGGISFTGGEPMLYPELLDTLVHIASDAVSPDTEIDLVTNGTSLQSLASLPCTKRISSIHISRHAASDRLNSHLMGSVAPSIQDLRSFISSLDYPGKIVFNCVLQKAGVETCEDIARFLDCAIDTGVQNTSFITMIKANSYCEDHYISVLQFPFVSNAACDNWNYAHPNSRFFIWNRHSDHDYCHCMSGSYHNAIGQTRFYVRCPGSKSAPSYCRQLVYTTNNKLLAGFNSKRVLL